MTRWGRERVERGWAQWRAPPRSLYGSRVASPEWAPIRHASQLMVLPHDDHTTSLGFFSLTLSKLRKRWQSMFEVHSLTLRRQFLNSVQASPLEAVHLCKCWYQLQEGRRPLSPPLWIPAFAGMTRWGRPARLPVHTSICLRVNGQALPLDTGFRRYDGGGWVGGWFLAGGAVAEAIVAEAVVFYFQELCGDAACQGVA